MKETFRKIVNLHSCDNMTKRTLNYRELALKEKGILRYIALHKYNSMMRKFCADIPLEAKIGENLTLPHGPNGIFISRGALIGKNCVIFQQVTIGSNTLKDSKKKGAPVIGDNVYIGAGAKIIGNVVVGNNCRIGANAVVANDVPDNSTIVLQHPRVIEKIENLNDFISL